MAAQRVREHLTAFGLSETEVDVYLGVLGVGTATTGDIADAADVSQGYVYEVVGALSERGLVTIDESSSPTTIHARPPGEALSEFTDRLDELEDAIAEQYAESESQPGFEVVHSRSTVRKRIRGTVEAAASELVVVVPGPEFEQVADALAAAVDRGVSVYLLLSGPESDDTFEGIDAPARYADVVRTWNARPPVFALADERQGVMGSYAVLSGRHGEETALSFRQAEIGNSFFGNVVANVWPMGETRYLTAPDPLPRTYDHLRTAVTHAALHRAAGRDLAADLVVEDTATGERMRFEGVPIREVRQSLVGQSTAAFPMENSLVFDVDGERRSVGNRGGGIDPFLEDYAAVEVTLRERAGSAEP